MKHSPGESYIKETGSAPESNRKNTLMQRSVKKQVETRQGEVSSRNQYLRLKKPGRIGSQTGWDVERCSLYEWFCHGYLAQQ